VSIAGHARISARVGVAARRISEFLIEPVGEGSPPQASAPGSIAVVALSPRCGTTTLARGIARMLGNASAVSETAYGQSPGSGVAGADLVILVAGAELEPAMARAADRSFGSWAGRVAVVVIGAEENDPRWRDVAGYFVPSSPWSARLVGWGAPASGALGEALRAALSLQTGG
jgi:hypothetical protein